MTLPYVRGLVRHYQFCFAYKVATSRPIIKDSKIWLFVTMLVCCVSNGALNNIYLICISHISHLCLNWSRWNFDTRIFWYFSTNPEASHDPITDWAWLIEVVERQKRAENIYGSDLGFMWADFGTKIDRHVSFMALGWVRSVRSCYSFGG